MQRWSWEEVPPATAARRRTDVDRLLIEPTMPWRVPRGLVRASPRTIELTALQQATKQGHRFVTLLGPSGAGKTMLAAEAARAARADCEGEIGWCALGHARDMDDARFRIARALSLGSQASGLNLVRTLRSRGRWLLVLDGVDSVRRELAEVIPEWLQAAPDLRVVLTARSALDASGEIVLTLGPHPEAVDLFVDMVAATWHRYAPSPSERDHLRVLLAPLEGVPQAIQMAAAIAWSCSPEALLEHLDRSLRLHPAVPPMMRAMHRATMACWDRLDVAPQEVLLGASVFAGSFTLQAAERVLGGLRDSKHGGVPEVLHGLNQRLLVREIATAPSEPGRFGLCDAVRSFAQAKLREKGEASEVALRHADHFLALAERVLTGPQEHGLEAPLRRLELDRDNLGAILDSVEEAECKGARWIEAQLRAAWVLDDLSSEMGLSARQLCNLDTALLRAGPEVAQGAVGRGRLVKAGALAFSPRAAEAEAECRAAIELADACQDTALSARAHTRLGLVLGRLLRAEEALAVCEIAIRKHQHTGDIRDEVFALEQEGTHLQALNRNEEAADRFERALWLCRTHGYARGELRGEAGLGYHYAERDDYRTARAHYERCVDLAREVEAHRVAMLATGYLGMLHFEEGRLLDAVECLSAAVAEARELDDPVAEGVFLSGEAAVRACMGDLEGAGNAAREIEQSFGSHPIVAPVARIHLAHLDLASGFRAGQEGNTATCAELRARALVVAQQARGQQGLGPNRSKDIRTALRILERSIEREGAPPPAPLSLVPPPCTRVSLATDGSWFQLGEGARVDLSRRQALRIMLAALGERRETEGDRPVSVAHLIAAAWPGEKFAWSSGLNRLHVALATLRSLGLRGILIRKGEGYLIDPAVEILRVPVPEQGPPSTRRGRRGS